MFVFIYTVFLNCLELKNKTIVSFQFSNIYISNIYICVLFSCHCGCSCFALRKGNIRGFGGGAPVDCYTSFCRLKSAERLLYLLAWLLMPRYCLRNSLKRFWLFHLRADLRIPMKPPYRLCRGRPGSISFLYPCLPFRNPPKRLENLMAAPSCSALTSPSTSSSCSSPFCSSTPSSSGDPSCWERNAELMSLAVCLSLPGWSALWACIV